MGVELGFIVEGHCEYESIPSIVAKIHGHFNYPIVNAKGIGNIIKNTGDQLLYLIKYFAPRKIIISLDYRDAEREGLVNNCVELKEMVIRNCDTFIRAQQNGSLTLPEEIVVVIAIKTYESWICADYENLKTNDLFDASKITEEYQNVDTEIPNPCNWLQSKLKRNIDMKNRSNRKKVSQTLRPDIAATKSRSFRKFYKEVTNINLI
jgi:hypothetical protein